MAQAEYHTARGMILEEVNSAVMLKQENSSNSDLFNIAAFNINQSKTSQKNIGTGGRNGASINSSSFTMKNVSAPPRVIHNLSSEAVELDHEESKAIVEKKLSLELQQVHHNASSTNHYQNGQLDSDS